MSIYRYLFVSFSACTQQPKEKKLNLPGVLPNGDSVVFRQNKEISLISLIANPDKYQDNKVRVIGYLHLEFEGTFYAYIRTTMINAISKNTIWVDLTRLAMDSLKKYSNHYVIMEGIFDGPHEWPYEYD